MAMLIVALAMAIVTAACMTCVDVHTDMPGLQHMSLISLVAGGVILSIVSGGRVSGMSFIVSAYLAPPIAFTMFGTGRAAIGYAVLAASSDIVCEIILDSLRTGDETLSTESRFILGLAISTSITYLSIILAIFFVEHHYLNARTSAFGIAAESADAAAKREKSANMEKTRFLSVMSHEIRTPLTGLLLHQDLLAQTRLSTYQKEHCTGMGRCAELVLALVSSVLDVAKIEAGTVRAVCAPFRLRDTCELIVSSHAAACAAKGVEIVLLYPPSLSSQVVGDEGKIRQVLNNLVSNAVKFTPSGSVVLEVSAEVVDEGDASLADTDLAPLLDELAEANRGTSGLVRWTFAVRDTGIGIPRTELSRTFKEFSRLHHPGHAPIDGTGLGLFITKQLTRLHGGTATVASEVGKGSTFTINVLMGGRCTSAGIYASGHVHRPKVPPSDLAITGLVVLTGLRDTYRVVVHYAQVTLPSAQTVAHCTSVRELEGKIATLSKVHQALLIVVDDATVGPVKQVPWLLRAYDHCRMYHLYLTDSPRSTDAAALGRKGWHAIVEKPLYLSRFVRTIQSLASRPAHGGGGGPSGSGLGESRRGGGRRIASSGNTSSRPRTPTPRSTANTNETGDSESCSQQSASRSVHSPRADGQWAAVPPPTSQPGTDDEGVPAPSDTNAPLLRLSAPLETIEHPPKVVGTVPKSTTHGIGKSSQQPAFFASSPMRASVDEAAPTILMMDPPYARSPGLHSVLHLIGGQVHQANSTEHALKLWRQLYSSITVVVVNADEDLEVVVTFVRNLRHHEAARRRAHVPIILVTSDRSVATQSRLAGLPVNEILQAPVSTKRMRTALAAVLPSSSPPSASAATALIMSTSPPKGQVKMVRRQKSTRRGGGGSGNPLRVSSLEGSHSRKRSGHNII
jgi:signal transduction histidine kinase/CheY-like chemotaxis protein